MFMLILIGTVNIFSASFVKAGTEYNNTYYFLNRHLMCLAIGFVCMILTIKFDYRRWRKLVPFILLATIAALIAVDIVGVEINGSRRWLNIGLQFQPSELAKLTTILFMAAYLGPRIDRQAKISMFTKQMGIIALMGFLVYRQPDLGTAAIIVGIAFFLHILAGMHKEEAILLSLAAITVAVALTFSASYRAERVWAWFDPWAYQGDKGYQTVQSIIAIGSGGFFGEGLGMGTSKFYYLPEAHTDFAFAILCQEMGFIGAMGVFFLIAALAFYSGKIARQAQDGFGKMLVIGITILVVGQGIANIAMVSGILPVIGVPLPFISYGGTSLIINMVAVGILVNVGRRAAKKPLPGPKGGEEAAVPKRTFKLMRKGA
jgi:cell division protein FtsW